MTARRRTTRARRLLSYLLPPSIPEHITIALDDTDDLTALADGLYPPDPRQQAEMIAACDTALWELELRNTP